MAARLLDLAHTNLCYFLNLSHTLVHMQLATRLHLNCLRSFRVRGVRAVRLRAARRQHLVASALGN